MPKVSSEQIEKLRRYSGLSKADCKDLLQLAAGNFARAKSMADETNAALASIAAERPGPRKRMTDPVLGRITWDGQWGGRAAATTLGTKVRLSVESPDGSLPDERQHAAYLEFLRAERKLAPAVKAAHLRYYRKARRLWARQMDEDFLNDLAPPVASADEVVAQLDTPEVHLPQQPRRGWQVQLRWECDWDPEHAHQVTIRNGAVGYAGPQDG